MIWAGLEILRGRTERSITEDYTSRLIELGCLRAGKAMANQALDHNEILISSLTKTSQFNIFQSRRILWTIFSSMFLGGAENVIFMPPAFFCFR
ncbi:hypothetical protein GJ744_002838 [Endocarpon pusillum]|uniref:Uncharacterized protein n=1 Tax=Endocarpon pusillum TaxID=364733 RepID=A0A8H7E0Z3_9EURO|nr:hypothetical protein GJ744_002838 [Endocarpon pusillum]